MPEAPILFSTPMVRAILEGRKTQTRRVVSRANSLVDGSTPKGAWWNDLNFDGAWVDPGPSPTDNRGPYLKVPYPELDAVHRVYPRRWAGDRLWVKETWGAADHMCGEELDPPQTIAYFANQSAVCFGKAPRFKPHAVDTYAWNWGQIVRRPSLFMPRWASRISLEVTGVRVERVQSITEMDHEAEGLGLKEQPDAFRSLWDKLNGKKAPWSSNPWVWVLEFRRLP